MAELLVGCALNQRRYVAVCLGIAKMSTCGYNVEIR
jgi:hypothetical protein